MLKTIVFAPLVGAVILGFFGKKMSERVIGVIACSAVAVSVIAAISAFGKLLGAQPDAEGVRRISEPLFSWIAAGRFQVDFGYLLDPLSGVMILFVTFVGFLIHVFATGYMSGEDSFYRFFAYMNLFMFMMLTLVLGENFLMMFVGWEGVGLCSYLLIGYYFLKGFAGDAAKKAFVVNRIGDFGFALAVMLIFYKYGNINFIDKTIGGTVVKSALAQIAAIPQIDPLAWSALWAGGLTTIGFLLFVGATGKSAQIPLFVWLPDAMAGPTPVSALIHAATMVTAGVYMVVRTNAIFSHAPLALTIVAVVGCLTAFFAATIGIAQWDIKKVLAYSTVSQLGYMFLGCGVGAFSAGFFHVVTHAFFKALLFLGSGSVIIGMHHEQDMKYMGGLSKYMKITFTTMLMGTLAIAGFPFLSGFFSKDEILWKTRSSPVLPGNLGMILYWVALLTAGITAFYMTRMMVVTFFGEERYKKHDEHGHGGHGGHDAKADAHDSHGAHGGKPHESPISMTLPLMVLAVLSVVGGFVGVPEGLAEKIIPHSLHNFTHSYYAFLEPLMTPLQRTPGNITGELAEDHSAELISTVLSVVVGLVGIGLGYVVFKGKPLLELPAVLQAKYYIDEIYDAIIVNPLKWISTNILWKVVDMRIIDGAVNGAAGLVRIFSGGLRQIQTGFARVYAAFIFLGALAVIGYFFFGFVR